MIIRPEVSCSIGFCILSLFSSVLAAHYEMTLVDISSYDEFNSQVFIHPFSENISTILDFAILNPLAIYFIFKSTRYRSIISSKFRKLSEPTPYHKYGLIILSIVLAYVSMKFYVSGFLSGFYFSAEIIPNSNFIPTITLTGWVVFLWTTIFITILFYGCFQQGSFVLSLSKFKYNDVQYSPFHSDESAGQKQLMTPTLNFTYAMASVLLIFAIFYFQDFVISDIKESKRIYGFALYIIIVGPLFSLPLLKLHLLMRNHRSRILNTVSENIGSIDYSDLNKNKIERYVIIADKYKSLAEMLPVWPLNWKGLTVPIGSIISAFIPLLKKLSIGLLTSAGYITW